MEFGFYFLRLTSKMCYLNSSKHTILSRLSFLIFVLIHSTRGDDDLAFATSSSTYSAAAESNELVFHQIEGKVTPPDPKPADWYWATRILVDGGKKLTFLKVNVT